MSDSKKQNLIIWSVGILVVLLVIWFTFLQERDPGELDHFASCLDEQGAVFYGSYTCPACQEQKDMFGSSEDLLPYVECSTPSGAGQSAVCNQKNIRSYPTWEFADGSRETGVQTLEDLAVATGCSLEAPTDTTNTGAETSPNVSTSTDESPDTSTSTD